MGERTLSCPNCGAAVKFRAAASVFAVCEFCQSTLLADDRTIRNLGKMAELLPDQSRLQIGAEGRYRDVRFSVVGRIQLQYERGLWNEWHLLYANGRSGWLSEVAGEMFITFEQQQPGAVPPFQALKPGQSIGIAGERFVVSNLQHARCVAGAGELPFAIGAGFDAPVVDLKSDRRFATLDYSDSVIDPPAGQRAAGALTDTAADNSTGDATRTRLEPTAADASEPTSAPIHTSGAARLFIGEQVEPKSLALINLRVDDAPASPAGAGRSLACPSCGASLYVSSESIRTIACRQCRAVLDPADPKASLLREAAGKLSLRPSIEIGSVGKFGDKKYEVIGYLRRAELTSAAVGWGEYLLRGPVNEFRWLIEYNGHWSLSDAPLKTTATPGPSTLRIDGAQYKHFSGYTAVVRYVIGEFNWRVKAGDQCAVTDYIAPPLMLSFEQNANDFTATRARYVEPAEIVAAFGLKTALGNPTGIAPNQPSPHKARAWTIAAMFVGFSVLLLLLQGGFSAAAGRAVRTALNFPADAAEATATSTPFSLPASRHLVMRTEGQLNNAWADMDIRLIDKKTGKVHAAERGLEAWSGVEDGESWSEAQRDAEVQFHDLDAGEYQLAVSIEQHGPGNKLTQANFSFEPQRVGWSNWALAQLLLMLCPLWAAARQWNFEVRRWADSDHPMSSSGGSDDDDD